MKKAIFEIFRTGKHNGKNSSREWTAKELENIALMYNSNVKPAPLVIGHPKDNYPQYGIVERLICYKNALFAESLIDDKLIEKINSQQISGISSSFIPPNHSDNPVSGSSFYLNHVGFLEEGKDRPAVKNMLPPEISVANLYFNERESAVLFFCENDDQATPTEQLHAKTEYLSNVLDVDYRTAFNLLTQ